MNQTILKTFKIIIIFKCNRKSLCEHCNLKIKDNVKFFKSYTTCNFLKDHRKVPIYWQKTDKDAATNGTEQLAPGVEEWEEEMWVPGDGDRVWGQPASGQHLAPWCRRTDHGGRTRPTPHTPGMWATEGVLPVHTAQRPCSAASHPRPQSPAGWGTAGFPPGGHHRSPPCSSHTWLVVRGWWSQHKRRARRSTEQRKRRYNSTASGEVTGTLRQRVTASPQDAGAHVSTHVLQGTLGGAPEPLVVARLTLWLQAAWERHPQCELKKTKVWTIRTCTYYHRNYLPEKCI